MSGLECDLLLFVATDSEQDELCIAARDLGCSWESVAIDGGEFWNLGKLGSQRVVAVRTRIGSIGRSGSTANANFYLAATQATGIVCLGMAFGISRDRQPLGTVLVSESLFPYDVRHVVPDDDRANGWKYEYGKHARVYRSKSGLLRIFRELGEDAAIGIRAEFGCLLSGSAVVRSAAFRDHLVRSCADIAPNIVGGEMEGAGFLSLSDNRANWIVVKGICDFGDERQGDDAEANRRLACARSSRFVLEALRRWNPDHRGMLR